MATAVRLPPRTRALLVEGATPGRASLARRLTAAGAEVEQAESLDSAPAILARWALEPGRPSLLLVDRRACGAQGLEVMGRLRPSGPPELRLVLLAALGESPPADERAAAGISETLTKPVGRARLLRAAHGLVPSRDAGAASAPPARWGGTGGGALPGVGPRAHVLVVEDNSVNQIVISRLLDRCGCRVELAADGEAALAAVARAVPDLILMDCQMPGIDGFEATRRLRALGVRGRDGLTPLAIVALTASATVEDRNRCLEAGMDDFLTKPIQRPALEAALCRWLPSQKPLATAGTAA